jgi:hypothetical protein
MKKAKLPNGEVLQFPVDTPDSVIDETVKRHMAEKLASNAGIGKVMNNEFVKFMGGAFESIIDVAVRRYLKNSKGDPGDQGDQGLQGDQGEKGDKGDRGDQGPEGKRGPRGDKGEQGERGLIGLNGDKGDRGERGEKGDQGEKGEKGDKGDRGEQGLPGEGKMGPPGGRGRPGAFWRGDWTAGVTYSDYDAVYYNGSSYVCKSGNVTTPPPGANWLLIAAKGQDGAAPGSLTLADIGQSGATSGQVPKWNGTAWVPDTVSGGGGAGVKMVAVASNTERLALTSSQVNVGDIVNVYTPAVTWVSPVYVISFLDAVDDTQSCFFYNGDNNFYPTYSDLGVSIGDTGDVVASKVSSYVASNFSSWINNSVSDNTITISFSSEGSDFASVSFANASFTQTVYEVRSASAVSMAYYEVIDISKLGTESGFIMQRSIDQSLNTTDTVTFATAITSGTSNSGNPSTVTMDPLYGFDFRTDNGSGLSQRGAMSWDDGEGSLNLYNRGSLAAIRVANDGTTRLGYYYGPNVQIDSSANITTVGHITLNGKVLSSNGTDLFWNGVKIN